LSKGQEDMFNEAKATFDENAKAMKERNEAAEKEYKHIWDKYQNEPQRLGQELEMWAMKYGLHMAAASIEHNSASEKVKDAEGQVKALLQADQKAKELAFRMKEHQDQIGLERSKLAAKAGGGASISMGSTALENPLDEEQAHRLATRYANGEDLSKLAPGRSSNNPRRDRIQYLGEQILAGAGMSGTSTTADYAATKKALGTRVTNNSNLRQYLSTFEKQADTVEKWMNTGVVPTGQPWINELVQKGMEITGNSDLPPYSNAIIGLSREHARIMTAANSQAQLHISTQELGDKMVSRKMNIPTMKKVISEFKDEINNAQKSGVEEEKLLNERLNKFGPGGNALNRRSTDYVETRTTSDGRKLGKKSDGTIEEIK
jgi:hypothetical protein